jgi:UDPglucose 6-dehydrogenase
MAPGPGWGGSCLPKDTEALLQVADSVDFEFRLLRATIDTNIRQRQRVVDKIRSAVTGSRSGSLSRKRLTLFGLTFKAGTDDLRDSPSLAVAALLRQAGAELVGHDPTVTSASGTPAESLMTVADDPYVAAKGADAIVVLTEWPQYRSLDWKRLADQASGRVVVDARNLLDADVLRQAGLTWFGLGRLPRDGRQNRG